MLRMVFNHDKGQTEKFLVMPDSLANLSPKFAHVRLTITNHLVNKMFGFVDIGMRLGFRERERDQLLSAVLVQMGLYAHELRAAGCLRHFLVRAGEVLRKVQDIEMNQSMSLRLSVMMKEEEEHFRQAGEATKLKELNNFYQRSSGKRSSGESD